MSISLRAVMIAGACALPAFGALAQSDLRLGLETFPALPVPTEFDGGFVHALSGDGRVFGLASRAYSPSREDWMLWSAQDGFRDANVLDSITGLNFDGSVLAGQLGNQAAIWDGRGTPVLLGTLGPDYASGAQAISGDGQVVVGQSQDSFGSFNLNAQTRAFRWSALSGMQNLGTLIGHNNSVANDTNRDGSVVVGASYYSFVSSGVVTSTITEVPTLSTLSLDETGSLIVSATRPNLAPAPTTHSTATEPPVAPRLTPTPDLDASRAVLWTETRGLVDLGTAGDPSEGSWADAVSADGRTVVGSSGRFAMRWTASMGMQHLSGLVGSDIERSSARDVSADGRVIVGRVQRDAGIRAFRWTQSSGARDLGLLEGASGAYALYVSDDGSIIVGHAFGTDFDNRPFIWRADRLLDMAATAQQITTGAARQMQAAQVLGGLTRGAFGTGVAPLPAPAVVSGSGPARPVSLRLGAAVSEGDDGLSARIGTAEITANTVSGLRFSGLIGLRSGDDALRGTGLRGDLTLAGFSIAGRAALDWRVALVGSGGTVRLSRPSGVPDTESGSGRAPLTSAALLLELSKPLTRAAARLTPFARLAFSETHRGAYTETSGAVFPVSYDSYTERATLLTLGLHSDWQIGPRGTLRLDRRGRA